MDQKRIGDFIAAERRNKNLTQAQLAEQLHISPKTVSRWETGKGLPEPSLMLPLCGRLGISVNELLSGARLDRDRAEEKAQDNLLRLLRERAGMKTRRIVSALLTVILTLWLMIGLYGLAFNVDAGSASGLEAAIDAYHDKSRSAETDVLEFESWGRHLFVLYRLRDDESRGGLVHLERGIFGKYRFLSCGESDYPLLCAEKFRLGGKEQFVIYGFRTLPGVASFKITGINGAVIYSSELESGPFLDIAALPENTALDHQAFAYFSAEGRTLDERQLWHQMYPENGAGGSGTGTAEGFLLYVYEGILLLLGFTVARYFLQMPPEKENNSRRDEGAEA